MLRLIFLFAALCFVSASPDALATSSCPAFYNLIEKELGDIKLDFLRNHVDQYDFEVPATPIRDQCSYGGCWVYGTLSNLEAKILADTGKNIDLSEQYVIVRSLQDRIRDSLEEPGAHLAEGGNFSVAFQLIDEFGLVPSAVWKPRIAFENSPHSGRLMTFLDNRLAQYHLAVAAHPEKIAELKAVAHKELLDILEVYSGPLPERFEFEGVNYASPKEFARAFLPEIPETTTRIFPRRPELPASLEAAAPTGSSNKPLGTARKVIRRVEDFPVIEKTILDAIKAGKTVPISVDLAREFIDRESGIMSVAAFHTPPGFEPVPFNYREAFDIGSGGHQMEVVGVDLDAAGKVVKYKIKNSYGINYGDHGYYHMYYDYFIHYLKFIVVP